MKWKLKEREVQYPILLFVVAVGLSITRGIENTVIQSAGRNGVWLFFPCALLVLAGAWVSLSIVSRLQSSSIMMAGGEVGPSILSPFLYLLYGALFLGGAGYALMLVGDFFSRTLLYGDQKLLMTLGPVLAGLMAMFTMETIGRYAHLLLLFIVPPFLLISLLPIKNAHWSFLLPLVDNNGWEDPLRSIAGIMLMFIPAAACTMLMSPLKDPQIKKSYALLTILMLFASLFGSFMLAMGITTYGVATASRLSFVANGTYGAIRLENFVLERIMFFAVLLWEFLIIVGSAFFVRSASFCFAQMLRIRLSPYLIILITVILAVLLSKAHIPFFFINYSYWLGCYSMFILIVLPVLLYLWMKVRGKAA
ncbi:hypothetical protein GCM10023310_26240 [Paenibacillus vulneris]|uniref:GerAB/ArcD/ProY family transporter n=1 Tax=Paenibacillus vulneris TaxID=1133364 RepID=A0ABW3UW31_9BACL